MRKYFGTDGIRRIANTQLTPELVFRVAKAGAYVLAKHSKHTPTILIGRDTRLSGTLIESAMTAGFLSYGANVKLLGVIPTPAVAYLTKKLNADASVVISASHNTYEFNGVKYFSNLGMKISDEIEEEIEKVMDSGMISGLTAVNEKIGISENAEKDIEEYYQFFEQNFKGDFQNLSLRVAIDTANGATSKVADEVFTRLGIEHIIIHNHPDGININHNCGSTHLESLRKFVVENHYDLGIAYDGDGDRCQAVDELGNVMDGDIIMAIVSQYLKKQGQLKKDTVVATVMSNIGFAQYAEKNHMHFVRTQVGDRYVLEEMLKQGYNFGGEQSGHIIFLDKNPTGDGILTSLMLIKSIMSQDKKASEASKIIQIYPQVLVNARVNEAKKTFYKDDTVITEKIHQLEEKFKNNGRVLIRPSGTEPLVRVMIEGQDQDVILEQAKALAELIENRLR